MKGTRYCYDNLIDGYFINLFETGLLIINKQKNENGSIIRVEEKPVVLYKELISRLLIVFILRYSNEGDIICDVVMGVGGCAVACIEMRRQFVGGDKDIIVYQRTIERVYEAAKQLIKTGLLF